jgi:hypothetical protein
MRRSIDYDYLLLRDTLVPKLMSGEVWVEMVQRTNSVNS